MSAKVRRKAGGGSVDLQAADEVVRHVAVLIEKGRLRPGDRLLFIGRERARQLQLRFLTEPGTFDYVRSGTQLPRGWLFRKLEAARVARRTQQAVPTASL